MLSKQEPSLCLIVPEYGGPTGYRLTLDLGGSPHLKREGNLYFHPSWHHDSRRSVRKGIPMRPFPVRIDSLTSTTDREFRPRKGKLMRATRTSLATFLLMVSIAPLWSEGEKFENKVVYLEEGRFAGWPANQGIWSWEMKSSLDSPWATTKRTRQVGMPSIANDPRSRVRAVAWTEERPGRSRYPRT